MPIINYSEAINLGYPKNKFFIQTILIDKRIPKSKAIQWLKDHHYKYNDKHYILLKLV